VSLLDDFLARRKMRRELEVFADHLAKQIRDSAADISPKHLHTGYEFGPVQQWLDLDIIAAARRGDRDAVLRIAEQSSGNGSISVAAITQRSWPNEN
jgi:hypothetical protein